MSSTDHYRYLNGGVTPKLRSQLVVQIQSMQARAPANQWSASVRALEQKGVKRREIDESGIIPWLTTQGSAPITRDLIVDWLHAQSPTIKEIDLRKPQYKSYTTRGYDSYLEVVYCFNSARNNVQDRLDEIRFELDDLDFNPDRLLKQPDLVFRLDDERRQLLASVNTVPDFKNHHFSNVVDPVSGSRLKNLFAHTRTTIRGNVFFIDEIQSDWAQRWRRETGERNAIAESMGPGAALGQRRIPDGPFISNTEAWSGLILRRLMQRAAEIPAVEAVAWIRGTDRNGGIGVSRDGLDDFYIKMLPKLADKVLKGTGEKIALRPVMLGPGDEQQRPGFAMTDAVRAKLLEPQPLYSADMAPTATPIQTLDATVEDLLRDAKEMLGSTVSVRLATRILHAATGIEMAGAQLGNVIEVSASARSATRALAHEAFHYAMGNLLSEHEVGSLREAFQDGSRLNDRIRQSMVAAGMAPEAVSQCDDADEAAAHAFSLWKAGRFHFDERASEAIGTTGLDRTVGRIFRKVEHAFSQLGRWVHRLLGERAAPVHEHVAETVFLALDTGYLATRNTATGTRRGTDQAAMHPRMTG